MGRVGKWVFWVGTLPLVVALIVILVVVLACLTLLALVLPRARGTIARFNRWGHRFSAWYGERIP